LKLGTGEGRRIVRKSYGRGTTYICNYGRAVAGQHSTREEKTVGRGGGKRDHFLKGGGKGALPPFGGGKRHEGRFWERPDKRKEGGKGAEI